jgi:uncharacterized protein DUF2786
MSVPDMAREFWEVATSPGRNMGRLAALSTYPPELVDPGANVAFDRALANTWPQGWLPYDLFQTVRRNLDPLAATLIVDAIAAETATYAPSTVHPRWRQQLADIGATVWWDPSSPHLSQWAARHSQRRAVATTNVLRVLSELMSLPKLPVILPLPGTSTVNATTSAGVDHKMLARVRALLAKAESTEFPDEADALSAKAQELMNRYAFDRALLMLTVQEPQSATSRRLWLDNPYVTAKFQLVSVIAHANRSRAVYYRELGFVALIGDELDLEIVELLSTSLLVQATKAMVAEQSRSRSYRHAFLIAYSGRIGERLRGAQELPRDDRLRPVLASREQAVDDLFNTLFTRTVTKSVSVSNAEGWGAGRAAADHANLTVDRPTLNRS